MTRGGDAVREILDRTHAETRDAVVGGPVIRVVVNALWIDVLSLPAVNAIPTGTGSLPL